MTQSTTQIENCMIGWDELRQHYLPVSRTTAFKMIREGRFPEPIRLSPRRIAWRKSDVLEWLKDAK